ncbi:flagellar basal body-associated FliL family protein [Azospirillum sp. sgz302134]
MRFLRQGPDGESISLAPLFIALFLLLLAALGTWGVVAVKTGRTSSESDSAVPKKNYAALPTMTFSLGGGDARMVDVKVLLEIEPTADPKGAVPFVPRIADQMADRLRQIEPDQLSGAEGAKLMKSTLTAVVNREMSGMRIREVLLDRMVVR